MIGKIIMSAMLILGLVSISACSDDEPSVPNSPSYRDGVYSGKQLTFTLNGEDMASVTSVTLTSTLLNANVSPDKGPDDFNYPSNPTYTTTVKISGFPKSGKTATFKTVSDLLGFSGTATIQGVEYEYTGEFTGDPLMHHDNQGLIMSMTTK